MVKIKEWQRKLEDWCTAASGIVFFFMMVITCTDLGGRYLMNSPLQGSYELLELLLPVAAYLPFAHVQRNKGHITVEFITERLRPEVIARLNLIVLAVAFGICALITWRTGIETVASFREREVVFGLIPYRVGPSRAFLTFAMGLLCLRLIADFIAQIGQSPEKDKMGEEGKETIHGF